jgi:ketosteroid isomerase-like protein
MNASLKTARELLLDYTSSIAVPERAAALFAEDGVIELPYLASLGVKWHVQGRDNIRAFLDGLLKNVPTFRFQGVEILIDTPDQVFGEYSVETTTAAGRKFSQLYAGRLVAKNGKIALLRESLDLVRAARAIFPNGLADVPPPT